MQAGIFTTVHFDPSAGVPIDVERRHLVIALQELAVPGMERPQIVADDLDGARSKFELGHADGCTLAGIRLTTEDDDCRPFD